MTTTTRTDLFAELTKGVQTLLSERATFNVDRKAGLLQVTDFPERLDRVSYYLDAVQDRVHRQVQIDARIVEVEIERRKGAVARLGRVSAQLTGDRRRRSAPPSGASLTGLRVTDLPQLMTALDAQGKVTTLPTPGCSPQQRAGDRADRRADDERHAADCAGRVVMLSLTPILTGPRPSQSDMLARVADGETLVIPGFTRGREVRERKPVGISGGWFGRGTVVDTEARGTADSADAEDVAGQAVQ